MDDSTWLPHLREDYLKLMQAHDVTFVDYDKVVEEAGVN